MQLNCRHSPSVHHDLLNTPSLPDEWDIIALQEPYLYPRNPQLTIATAAWIVLYPTSHPSSSNSTIRSIMLINKKFLSQNYHQLSINSPFITAIRITLPNQTISLFNIYNPPDGEYTAISHLNSFLSHNPTNDQMIWLGDFNSHHAMWAGIGALERTQRHDASPLIQLLSEHWMQLASPRGTPTFVSDANGAQTTIDLVFTSSEILDSLKSCTVSEERIAVTDHRAVMSIFDLSPLYADDTPRRNFRQADWEEFRTHLRSHFDTNPPPTTILTHDHLDQACQHLTTAIQSSIEATVPVLKPYTHQKRWWTKELTTSRKHVAKLSRLAFRHPHDQELQKTYKRERNAHQSLITRTKEQHWRDFLENPSEKTLWDASRLASKGPTDGGASRIPTLVTSKDGTRTQAITNEEKSRALYSIFFPPPPHVPANLDEDHPLPLPFTMPPKEQLKRNIMKQSPYKAPGPDGIPNIVLQKSIEIILSPLYSIFQSIMKLSYFPPSWLEFSTVVCRKPGRGDYTAPKSFRPIALFATFYKVITSTMCESLADLTERHNLLPANHFGGRPGRTTSDALLLLVQRIKDAWRRRNVVTAVMLDISNAFPNAVKHNLLHHLRKRRVPSAIVKFVDMILTGRTTTLRFDDFISESFGVENGIGQGDALSMLLYIFYNADILEIPENRFEGAGAYADDIYAYAVAPTFDQADEILREMFKRKDGLFQWAQTHNSVWEMSKSHCIRFTRRRNVDRNDFTIDNLSIPCSRSAKLLGVIIDQELRWKEHAEYAVSKGTKLLMAITRLTRPTFGMPHKHVRRLFIAVALPKIEYAAEVWFEPIRRVPGRKPLKGSVGMATRISKVQNLAARLITGAQRSTPIELLLLHANLVPTRLRMEEQVFKATLRLCTLPETHPLHHLVRRCANRYVQSHRSPLHELFHAFDIHPDSIETRSPFRHHSPDWSPPFLSHISPSKDDAADFCKRRQDDVRIFTDGSGFEGGIGAAATLHHRSKKESAHYFLGTSSENTVFEAEVCGVILASHLMLSHKPHNPKSLLIALDNQACIQALRSNSRQPSQYLLDEAVRSIEAVKKKWPRIQITLAWAPGHHGLAENEAVDAEAKKAAQGLSSTSLPKTLRKRLPDSYAAIKAAKRQEIQKTWMEQWLASPRYQRFKHIDPWSSPSKLNRLLSNLPRRESSLLTQLRTGHNPLNTHLARIKVTDSSLCPKCHLAPETVDHILRICHRYSEQRAILSRRVRTASSSTRRLLSEPKIIPHTIKYLKSINRFFTFF